MRGTDMTDSSQAEGGEHLVLERIEDWRRLLIDLSYRNRLIRYRPTKASTIEIESPELEKLLHDPGSGAFWRFYFPPDLPDEELGSDDAANFVDDVVVSQAQHAERQPLANEIVVKGETSARRVNRLLENLARKSNAEFQDKALRILYIAAGFLDWTDPTRNEPLSSPLLLVPVELKRESASQPYRLHFVDDEEITVNPSLTEKLRRDLGRDIPVDWEWEAKPISTELDEIQAAVADKGWAVRRDAVIGLFSFQKFVMYRDLLDNEAFVARHPIIKSIALHRLGEEMAGQGIEIPELADLDEVQPPDSEYCILDADATQRRCIEAARRGQSFVA